MSRHPAVARVSLVVSLLALLLALTGTAIAAGLAANSVGSKQLKNNAVKTAKIKDNAVTGAKVKDATLTGGDLANGSVGKADLAAGVLPAAPVTIYHDVATGTAMAPVVVGGVRFQPLCVTVGPDTHAQFTIQPAAVGANDLSTSGVRVDKVGGTPTAGTSFGTGISSSEPKAVSFQGGGASVTTYEGVVRSGTGPWLRISLGMDANDVVSDCQLQAVITVLG